MILNRAEELIRSIGKLKKTHVRTLVKRRVLEFKELGEGESREIFKELCFCILCANYSAERAIKIQRQINDGFLTLSKQQLVEKLKELGHRFPKTRAEYIV
ncbi:N-glycosylase, partial [Candidatus Bathyarchaeota archaeon]